MSETTLLAEIQDILETSTRFERVTVNDHSWLDVSMDRFAVVDTSDILELVFRAGGTDVDYQIFVTVYEPFTDWQESYNDFMTTRQAVIDALRAYDAVTGVIQSVRTDAPIRYVSYDDDQALPVFIVQRFVVTVRDDA